MVFGACEWHHGNDMMEILSTTQTCKPPDQGNPGRNKATWQDSEYRRFRHYFTPADIAVCDNHVSTITKEEEKRSPFCERSFVELSRERDHTHTQREKRDTERMPGDDREKTQQTLQPEMCTVVVSISTMEQVPSTRIWVIYLPNCFSSHSR